MLEVVFISMQITCTYLSIKLEYPGLRFQKGKKLWRNVAFMHQSIPAAPSPPPPHLPTPGLLRGICPPCQSRGWGICKFCAARGPGICRSTSSFWHARGFLSEYNYTKDFTGKTSTLTHLLRTGKIEEVCKGMFSILCMHFFITYQARIT